MPVLYWLGYNLVESFVDNVIRDKVYACVGSVLYYEMAFGAADHSGVYVGNGMVVELGGDGWVRKVSIREFMNAPALVRTGRSLYVSSRNGCGIGSKDIAKRAMSMVGTCRNYNLLLDNCHQFTSGCVTGDFENSDNFLWMLKHTVRKTMQADEWRVWDI